MSLLERIAASHGNPDRTIRALRLLNSRLIHERDLARSQAGAASTLPEPSQIDSAKSISRLATLLARKRGGMLPKIVIAIVLAVMTLGILDIPAAADGPPIGQPQTWHSGRLCAERPGKWPHCRRSGYHTFSKTFTPPAGAVEAEVKVYWIWDGHVGEIQRQDNEHFETTIHAQSGTKRVYCQDYGDEGTPETHCEPTQRFRQSESLKVTLTHSGYTDGEFGRTAGSVYAKVVVRWFGEYKGSVSVTKIDELGQPWNGIIINLYNVDEKLLNSQPTPAFFDDLGLGEYIIKEVVPAGTVPVGLPRVRFTLSEAHHHFEHQFQNRSIVTCTGVVTHPPSGSQIPNKGLTISVDVSSDNATQYRLVNLNTGQVIAGPQADGQFLNVHVLPNQTYQAQVRNARTNWVAPDCLFHFTIKSKQPVCNRVVVTDAASRAIPEAGKATDITVHATNATQYRLVRLSPDYLFTEPQENNQFTNIYLVPGQYQAQVKNDLSDWTTQGCRFEIPTIETPRCDTVDYEIDEQTMKITGSGKGRGVHWQVVDLGQVKTASTPEIVDSGNGNSANFSFVGAANTQYLLRFQNDAGKWSKDTPNCRIPTPPSKLGLIKACVDRIGDVLTAKQDPGSETRNSAPATGNGQTVTIQNVSVGYWKVSAPNHGAERVLVKAGQTTKTSWTCEPGDTSIQLYSHGEQPYDESIIVDGVKIAGLRDGMMPLVDKQPTYQEVLDSFGASTMPIFIDDEGNGAANSAVRIIQVDLENRQGGWTFTAQRELTYLRTPVAHPDGTPKGMIRFELPGGIWIRIQIGEHLDASPIIWIPLSKVGEKVDLTCVRYQGGVYACGLDPFSDMPDNTDGFNDRGKDGARTISLELCRRGFATCNNVVKAQLARNGETSVWSENGIGPWAEQGTATLYGQVIYYNDTRDYPTWIELDEQRLSFRNTLTEDQFRQALQTLPAPPVPGQPGYGSPWAWANPTAQ